VPAGAQANGSTVIGVLKTADGGSTWAESNTGLADLGIMSLAIDPVDTARILAGTAKGVFISTDCGANWTATDYLFIYLISGASAGNYQIVKITTVSAAVGAILAAALTYTLPYGTYVYCMDDSTIGNRVVGSATWEISNAGGWLAAPSDSPLLFDFVGPAATAMRINSVFCTYQ
jgi:hypothetical protein